jgi:hypothetical protein
VGTWDENGSFRLETADIKPPEDMGLPQIVELRVDELIQNAGPGAPIDVLILIRHFLLGNEESEHSQEHRRPQKPGSKVLPSETLDISSSPSLDSTLVPDHHDPFKLPFAGADRV